ncbi:FlgO family outer membrane protein [Shewanella sp. YIC-542]|uniref:FlgO family outer membrane protein n=1 Tax=Shewanella mytili TaxID=3377111 RepID=UPI00398F5410
MKLAIMFSMILLAGCSHSMASAPAPSTPAIDNALSNDHGVIGMSGLLAQQLVQSGDDANRQLPLLVATPVMVEDLQSSDKLAAQLQQGLMTQMQQAGFTLVDLNVADAVRVTPTGDFLLSRDWQKVPANIEVAQVLVSTVSKSRTGLLINSRIVLLSGNQVVASAQLYVSQQALPEYVALSPRVVSQNGLLYRNDAAGKGQVQVLGEMK